MRIILAALTILILASCASPNDVTLQAVETAGYWVIVNDVNTNDDCRLTFADRDGLLAVEVKNPIEECSIPSTAFIQYELAHRDEAVSSPSVFTQGGIRRFDSRPVQRFLEPYRAFTVRNIEQAEPDSVVVLIPKVGLAGFDAWGGLTGATDQ